MNSVRTGKVSGRETLFVGARRKARNRRSGSPHIQNVATDVLWTTEDIRLWCVSVAGSVPCNAVLLRRHV